MKLVKKSIVLIILLNILFITCTYAVSNSSSIIVNSNVISNTNTNSNTADIVINNNSSNTTSDVIINPNPDSNYVPLEKDEVEDYFASIAVEKESVTDFMSKIEGNKLLDAICNKQTALGNRWMEDNRDTFAKMEIELIDWENKDSEGRAQTTATVSCDLLKNTNTVINSSNNYVHTGITAACFITKKDGSEIGFNLGEVKISLKGDISGQGDIGVVDLSLMQQELVDEITLKDEFLRAADMDTSYEIDVIDLSMLQEYIVNN